MTAAPVHRYRATCTWQGSTGGGYGSYSRAHEAASSPAEAALALSADPAFAGDPSRLNPEQLLVVATSSCQLLSFLAVAARAGVDVVAYADDAEGLMPEGVGPVRLTEVHLRPRITVRPPATGDVVEELCERAHRECFVANTLACTVTVAPTVTVAAAGTR